MDISHLYSRKYSYEAAARGAEGQARQYDQLALNAKTQLNHKKKQLEKAIDVRADCQAVKSNNTHFETDLLDTARNIDYALDAGGAILGAIDNLVCGNAQDASTAYQEADRLVAKLQKECEALQGQLADYQSKAETARSQAASHWSSASSIQWQINRTNQSY